MSDKETNTSAITPSSTTVRSKTTLVPSYQKKFHCNYEGCTKSFNRPARLADHSHTHTNTRPYTCPHLPCTKDFLRKSHLKQHIDSIHIGVRKHICEWKGCDKSFVTATKLRKHLKTHENREKYRCTVDGCEQTFRKHGTLQRHIAAGHTGRDVSRVCEVTGDDGQICGSSFATATKLRRHVDRVHGGDRYWCTICEIENSEADEATTTLAVGFATYSALQKHNKEVHPPTCSECGYTCLRPREMTLHMNTQHGAQDISERKTHVCTIDDCESSFTRKTNLDVHMRTVHNGEKAFVCGTIDLSSSKKLTGWTAEIACGKAYTSKSSLEEHVRTAHFGLEHKRKAERQEKKRLRSQKQQDQGALALGCLIGIPYGGDERRNIPCLQLGCTHRFIREYDLDVHLRSKHGLADFEIQYMKSASGQSKPIGQEYNNTAEEANLECRLPLDEQLDVTNNGNASSETIGEGFEHETEDTAKHGGYFWINKGHDNVMYDEWEYEEREMRNLIDQEVIANGQVIDPALK